MNFSAEFLLGAAVQLVVLASAWGHLAARQESDRRRGDERHIDNQSLLREIRDDVKRINGKVHEHDARLDALDDR